MPIQENSNRVMGTEVKVNKRVANRIRAEEAQCRFMVMLPYLRTKPVPSTLDIILTKLVLLFKHIL